MSAASERLADNPAITAIAEQVTAGKDAIAVPTDMVEEPPKDKEPEKREPALWMQIKAMTMAERTKLALRGNKEARMMLIRDVNIQIQRLVLHNPRITEEEILQLSKDRNTDEELLAWIADSREWMSDLRDPRRSRGEREDPGREGAANPADARREGAREARQEQADSAGRRRTGAAHRLPAARPPLI